jgi:hypothetical protein
MVIYYQKCVLQSYCSHDFSGYANTKRVVQVGTESAKKMSGFPAR